MDGVYGRPTGCQRVESSQVVIKAPRALRRTVSVGTFGSMIEFEEVAPGVFSVAHDFVKRGRHRQEPHSPSTAATTPKRVRRWRRVEELEVLVPGHGPVMHGRDEAREWIEWEADYLAAVRDRVREMLREGRSEALGGATAEYAWPVDNAARGSD